MLLPAAEDIDVAEVVPAWVLDRLGVEGLYGLFGPRHLGGFDADEETAAAVVETLGGASASTAFVWIQHHSALRAVLAGPAAAAERWAAALCRGESRAGIAVAALRRPGPPAMRASRVEGGWTLEGVAPWVTGWDRIDVVLVAAAAGDDIVWSLLDATASPGLAVRRQALAAMGATSTVTLSLRAHFVADERVLAVESRQAWRGRDRAGLRLNGFLPLGVAARAAVLLGDGALLGEVDRMRRSLLRAPLEHLAEARAAVSLLAVRAATALVAAGGGASVELASPAQRLAREAMFFLVFGQTAPIRAAQLALLAGAGPEGRGDLRR